MQYFQNRLNDSALRIRLRNNILQIITLLLGGFLIIISNYLYIKRIASFRFVDEYTNMAVGYLMQSGRILYQQIFFHHHPLPVIISSFLQQVIPTHSLYELVKIHRYSVLCFSLMFACLLMLRFRMRAVILVTFYEVLKYYFFGYQYLGEAFIPYPIAYMTLLIFETAIEKTPINWWDTMLSAVLTWWIIFQREPYALLALFLFFWIIRMSDPWRKRGLGIVILISLSVIILDSLALTEYFRQIFVLNSVYATHEVGGSLRPFVQGMTYLVGYIITGIQTQHVLYLSLGLLSLGVCGVFIYLVKTRSRALLASMIALILLAGIRNPALGSLWFNMYRLIPHIVVLLCIVSYFTPRSMRFILVLMLGVGMLVLPTSHFKEHRDNANEFYINYSETDSVSQVITAVCQDVPCKLHVDGEDSLVYWQTKLPPWFQYSVFYNVQEGYLDYAQKRRMQFILSPPDVFCRSECKVRPEFMATVSKDKRFVPLMKGGAPSCIWITKKLSTKITDAQKDIIKRHGYSLD